MHSNRWVLWVVLGLVGFGSAIANAATIVVPKDFATIGEALAAAGVGDEIVVKKGTYPENLTITTDGLRLVADGKVKLKGSGAGNGIAIAGVDECHVIGFEIRDFAVGILVSSCANIEISDCRFVDIGGSAVELNAIGGSVSDCQFQRVEFGIRALAANSIAIRRNEIVDCLDRGIVVEGTGIVVAKNEIDRCGVIGIQIGLPTKGLSQATHVVVEKNKVSNVQPLIAFKGVVEQAGIDVDYNSVDVALIGNTVKQVSGKGIRIGTNCIQPMVLGNKVSVTSGAGIEVAASQTTVVGNKVVASEQSGIHVVGMGATDCYVLDNNVKECEQFGIRLGSSFGYAVWNKVRDCIAGSISEDVADSNFIGENDTDD